MAYIQPQVQVFQEFQQLPQSVVANLNAFIFGPNYKLMRYAEVTERALIGLGVYDPAETSVFDYPNQPAGSTVDLDYVKLYMEDVWAHYASVERGPTTKLVAVSDAALNKLRAIPNVEDAEASATTDGVDLQSFGCVYEGPDLPETFYLTPSGGAVGGAWTRMSSSPVAIPAGAAWTGDDAVLGYRAVNAGQGGTVDVRASDNPLTAGVTIQGPYGIVLECTPGERRAGLITYTDQPVEDETVTIAGQTFTFKGTASAETDILIGTSPQDTYNNLKAAVEGADIASVYEVVHADNSVWVVGNGDFVMPAASITGANVYAQFQFAGLRSPAAFTFRDTEGTDGFTLEVDPYALSGAIDSAIDNDQALSVTYSEGALDVSFDMTTRTCSIVYLEGTTTLSALRAAIAGNSDVAAMFTVSGLNPDVADNPAGVVADEAGAPVTLDIDIPVLRDVYRISVLPNAITWASGNGYTNSNHFKSRGVRVGDRLRYEVTDTYGVSRTGTTQVAGLEADVLAARVDDPGFDVNNRSDQSGTMLIPHTGARVLIPGAGNQVKCNGAQTRVYALSDSHLYYGGNYSAGVLSDVFTIEVTVPGGPGQARCTVTNASGTYRRELVPITPINWDHPQSDAMGMVDLGNNLWAVLHEDAPTVEFKAGDAYTFSRALDAPWTPISQAHITADGHYTGPIDTTYLIKVIQGGVFDRTHNVIDGLQTPNKVTLEYTAGATVVASDTVTVGGRVFEFIDGGTASAGNTPVNIGGASTEEDKWNAFVSAVNSSDVALYASYAVDSKTINIRGSYAVLNAQAPSCDIDNVTVTSYGLSLQSQFDMDALGAGLNDADDEYILRCTSTGKLSDARFTLESLQGDNQSFVVFSGAGANNAARVGSTGLTLYFDELSDAELVISKGDYWVIRVNATRPRVQITDTAGVDQSTYAIVNDGVAFNVGNRGVQAAFTTNRNTEGGFAANGGLVTGDIFYVQASAKSEGPVKTLVLADDLPATVIPGLELDTSSEVTAYRSNYQPSAVAVELYLVQGSAEIGAKNLQALSGFNWEASESNITLNAGIAVQDASWYNPDGTLPFLPVYTGDVYVEYRALLEAYTDGIYSLRDIGDVVTELGAVHPDNPLAQGVYNALMNAGDQSVYFMAVPSDDLEGYSKVLNQAAKTDAVYGLTPLTRDMDILAAVEGHIDSLSGPESKRWRLGFVGTALPTVTPIYTATTSTPAGTEWKATVTANPGAPGAPNTVLRITTEGVNCLADVRAGDEVRINFQTDAWGDTTYASYTVESVGSNNRLILSRGPDTPITVDAKVEVWRVNTVSEIATAVAARSSYFANRRIYHVFPDVGYMDGVAQTAEFMAAAVAGLTSSVPPQQGLTNISVNGFTDLPAVYTAYSRDQLNEMAAGGTLILMQDMAGSEVYVRHQVSTASSDGNLLTTELSVAKNLDAVSYYFAGVLQPFIGRYNITPELLVVLRTQVKNGLNFMASDQTGAGLLGPMVIGGENTDIRSLGQHPTLRDHVSIIVDLELPLPMNVIQLRLVV